MRAVRERIGVWLFVACAGAIAPAGQPASANRLPEPGVQTAIVGATLIDGSGKAPVSDITVLIAGDRIAAIGRTQDIAVPAGAVVVDARGRFLVPGFVDTNVHLSITDDWNAMERHRADFVDIAIEGAQLWLKHGVTTVRDSYGMLRPVMAAREACRRGGIPCPRILVAGNIVGTGGEGSATFGGLNAPRGMRREIEQELRDAVVEGTGEELIALGPEALREKMAEYLDKGGDFIKFGGTVHNRPPHLMLFSPRAQRIIVDEAHRRQRPVDTHANTSEAIRLAVLAGVDVVQHPEYVTGSVPKELVDLMVRRKVVCSMRPSVHAGPWWADRMKQVTGEASRMTEIRENARTLIRDGCIVSVSTDFNVGGPPDAPDYRRQGSGTLAAIEALVELGMSPMDALVSATRNGAYASRASSEYGTIERGKFADLLLLDGSPVLDIHNIRRQAMVMKGGERVSVSLLPTKRVISVY